AILTTIAQSLGSQTRVFRTWTGTDPCGTGGGPVWRGVLCAPAANSTSNATFVTSLILQQVDLLGTLPASLFNLTTLQLLDLSLNKKLSGSLPSTIGQLTSLTRLALSGCSFTDSLPTTLAALTGLQMLDLNTNNLTGRIPTEISSLVNLSYFDVTSNKLEGLVPAFGPMVEHLHLSNNKFSSLSSTIGSLKRLIHLLLDHNQLNHDVPAWIANSRSLKILDLSNNRITGTIPRLDMSSLESLILYNSHLPPQPLPSFDLLPALADLELTKNQFNGTIPPTLFTSHSNLVTINLQDNNLTGTIPPDAAAADLPNLCTISLSGNNLTGDIPKLRQLPALMLLSLYDNHFTSAPSDLLVNPTKNTKDKLMTQLYGNPLCSPYQPNLFTVCSPPAEFPAYKLPPFCTGLTCDQYYHPNYPLFKLSNKNCSCVTTLEVQLRMLAPQYTTYNRDIVNKIRGWLRTNLQRQGVKMKWLQIVISSILIPTATDSDVTVTILFFPPLDDPGWQQEPARTYKKRIPNLFDAHKLLLLGSAMGPYTIQGFYGPDDPHANVTSPAPPAPGGIAVVVVVGILAGGVAILALLLVGLTWLLLHRQKRRDWWGKEDYEAIEGLNLVGVQRFKLAELADATQGFKTLLGEGGYGQVYHGQLPSGEKVAVKRAKPDVQVNGKEFRNEIELLSAVRHRNLVVLRGFCVEAGEQLLVYEFIEKGTLEDILRGKSDLHLTWKQRLDIACGAARGFAYLHHQIKPPIIHRDVKTANILITAAGEAKVADFGISKAVMEGEQLDTQVKGTVGYLDPEYYMSDLLTEKSDVFSFGIVLLEIATGLRPISDNQHIRQLVIKRVMAGGRGATAVIDPVLLTGGGNPALLNAVGAMEGGGGGGGGSVEVVVDSAGPSQGSTQGGIPEEVEATFEWFLKLGMRCSARLSQDRPAMQHVAAELDAMRARVIQIARLRGGTSGGGNDAGSDGGGGTGTGGGDAAAAAAAAAGAAGGASGAGTGVSSATFNSGASSKASTGASPGVSTTGASSAAFSTGTSAVSEERFWEDMANEGALVPGFNDDEEEMEYGQEVYDNMTGAKGEGHGRQGTVGVSGSVGGGGYTSSSSEGVWRAGGSTTGWTSDSAPSREM
ncbi:unnamed protein product, partial [Closterium sp. Naga37s-1]